MDAGTMQMRRVRYSRQLATRRERDMFRAGATAPEQEALTDLRCDKEIDSAKL